MNRAWTLLIRTVRRGGRLTEGHLWALTQSGVITPDEFRRCRVARRATRPLTLDEMADLAGSMPASDGVG